MVTEGDAQRQLSLYILHLSMMQKSGEVRPEGRRLDFKVTKNPHGRPFVVKAVRCENTGIRHHIFDVKAYRKDAPKVTLMEGKVEGEQCPYGGVECARADRRASRRDKIVVSKASSSASDWLEGDFDMDQVTLAEAMSDMEPGTTRP